MEDNILNLQNFYQGILKVLKQMGVKEADTSKIAITGSSLFVPNKHDIDVIVIVKRSFYGMGQRRFYKVQGLDVDILFFTSRSFLEAFNSVDTSYVWLPLPHYWHLLKNEENTEYKADEVDLLKRPEIWRGAAKYYYHNYVGVTEIPLNKGVKRYWNFLLFYFVLMNQSYTLTPVQKKLLQAAHDGYVSREDCLNYYDKLLQFFQQYGVPERGPEEE